MKFDFLNSSITTCDRLRLIKPISERSRGLKVKLVCESLFANGDISNAP